MMAYRRYYYVFIYLIIPVLFFSACDNPSGTVVNLVSQKDFDTIIDGKQVHIYTLRNGSGCVAQFSNFGGRWISMWVPDKTGRMTDVVLGFNSLNDYLSAGEPYHGAIVGRICGRINNASFSLDGIEYPIASNDGFGKPVKNHLHGGIEGFHRKVWNGKTFLSETGEQGIVFSYLSKDGEEGFPGELKVDVTYLLTNENELRIEYKASTNKPTIVNLTNHAFFNLNGEGNGDILNHQMKIYAEKYIECDRELIPTGKIKPVKDTPLDYLDYAPMGQGIDQEHDQIINGRGYATAMVLKEQNSDELKLVAEAFAESSGIKMEVFSDQPSLQIYNAWLFDGKDIGKSGKPYTFSGGFVMETQGYPDAPNNENFPSIVLRPGDEYYHIAIYKFSLNNQAN